MKEDGHIDPAKSERRNQRGQLPKQMRHAKKVELSDSDDDAQDAALEDVARSQTLALARAKSEMAAEEAAEQMLAIHEGTQDDTDYILKSTRLITTK